MVDISIVIVNWNTRELLLDCLDSVFKTITDVTYEVWVVDNGSSDGSVESIRQTFPGVKIIENEENLGFAAANNIAFGKMNGRYAVLLNTDARLTDGAIHHLYDFMEAHPKAAMACGQLLNPDGAKQNSIANFPSFLSLATNETVLRILFPGKFPSKRRTYTDPIEVESCIGACMMVRKKAMDEVGTLDERYFFFFEETDWAFRMKKNGWKIYFVPDAGIFHAQGKSAGHGVASRIMYYRSRYAFFRKWRPKSCPFFFCVIFIRLLVNALLCLLAIGLTLGLAQKLNKKFLLYGRLIGWHLTGCP